MASSPTLPSMPATDSIRRPRTVFIRRRRAATGVIGRVTEPVLEATPVSLESMAPVPCAAARVAVRELATSTREKLATMSSTIMKIATISCGEQGEGGRGGM